MLHAELLGNLANRFAIFLPSSKCRVQHARACLDINFGGKVKVRDKKSSASNGGGQNNSSSEVWERLEGS